MISYFEVYNTVTNGPDSYSERMKDPDANVIVYSSGYVLYIPAVDIKVVFFLIF